MTDAEYPLGTRVGDWVIAATLGGSPMQGRYRAKARKKFFRSKNADDEAAMLVTIATVQRAPFVDRVGSGLQGVAPMLDVVRLSHPAEDIYDAMIEPEPPGESLASAPPEAAQARGIAIGLAAIVARVHAADRTLCGGLRPELVYTASNDKITALAPRAEAFFANATVPSQGFMPCFEDIYAPPEMTGTPADDIFALCATIVFVVTGQPPFEGSRLEQLSAATLGAASPATPPEIAAGLVRDPKARPSAKAVLDFLARV